MQKLDLPSPGEAEKQHSARLIETIHNEIQACGGWLGFDRFMQMALYAPGLGYYAAGLQKFGEQGDFMTSPEVSSLFAQSLARPVGRVLEQLGDASIIEFGAGSGQLALELLRELDRLNQLPEAYLIVELSADLQQRQQSLLQAEPHLLKKVRWLDQLPEEPIDAVVIANEVLDAMPVKRFSVENNGYYELGVAVEEGALVIQTRPADTALKAAIEKRGISAEMAEYTSELNPYIEPWLSALSAATEKCAVYLIDYGYPQQEYYSADRHMGTLMGYYRHRAIDQPLWYPGIQDLTAFVDFTDVAEAALQTGFDVDGFTSQGNFLLNCGITDLLVGDSEPQTVEYIKRVQQVKTLSMPGEMGERFKVMGLSRGLTENIPGFEQRDMRYRL